jgi:hypothetical protein
MLLLHDGLMKSGQNEIYLKQHKARREKKRRGEKEKGQKRREEKRREDE